MGMGGYWTDLMRKRLGRRRALAAAGAATAGSVLLAACGDEDNDGTGSQPSSGIGATGSTGQSGLVTEPRDTSSQAKRGGVWLEAQTTDVQTFDPNIMSVASVQLNQMAYSRLFRPDVGHLKAPVFGAVTGDAVRDYEYSPDKLQLTLKLRPNKWHNLPPVNGRDVDAEDIVFSFERLAAIATQREYYVGEFGGPIDSVSAIDKETVVVKLNRVYAPMLAMFGTSANGNFYLSPREAEDEGALDLRRTQVGSGPWMLQEYTPSVGLKYVRHDGWYDAGRLYVDEIDMPILSEYSTTLAQFQTGRIYSAGQGSGFVIRNEDVLPAKGDNEDLNVYVGDMAVSTGFGFYGWNPAKETPFRDQRLRQALSMSWDRDLWIDTFLGTVDLQANGVPVEVRWNTCCLGSWEGWWLDPRGSDFGPTGKFYEQNIEEAKKLVSAAGFPDGLDIENHHIVSGEYGLDFPKMVETYASFAREVGLRLNTVPAGFTTDWRPIADSRGDFSGISFRGAGGNNAPDVAETMVRLLHPDKGGVTYTGFFSEDSSFQRGDPELTALLDQTESEFDQDVRVAIIQDVQRIQAERQYVIRVPGGTNGLRISWPVVQNENVFRQEFRYVGQWIDPTQAPLA